jgi:glycosyltransferase involved in cell wall biosynthesis
MAGPPLVEHVVPSDLMRGAQLQLSIILRQLATGPDRHGAVTLFDGAPGLLEHGASLGVRSGRLRRAGFDPRVVGRLRRHLDDRRPAVVVAHGGEALKYVVAARPGVPVVYHRIGVSAAPATRGWRRWLYRRLVHRAALVVAISTDTARDVEVTHGARPERVMVVPNGRDPEVFHPRPGATAAEDVRLVFVGHMTATKRPHLFIDVVQELARRGMPVAASMAGDGPLLDSVRRSAPARVGVLGPRTDVPDLLRSADVFVFPSLPESEGLPGVLVEAALSGLPIVATRTPGASDVVADGETGFLVDPEDVDAMVEATARLAGDPDLRQRMGRAGRTRALERFTAERYGAAWQDVIDRVLHRARAAG